MKNEALPHHLFNRPRNLILPLTDKIWTGQLNDLARYTLGDGVKIGKFNKKKRLKINSVGWRHTRVENNKKKQSPGQSFLQHRIPSLQRTWKIQNIRADWSNNMLKHWDVSTNTLFNCLLREAGIASLSFIYHKRYSLVERNEMLNLSWKPTARYPKMTHTEKGPKIVNHPNLERKKHIT